MQFLFNNLNALRCPITHELFIEPVIGSDCHTYERTAILDWLKRKEISPMTCEPMSSNSLRSNLVMKNIIEELSQLNKINKDTSPPPIPPRQPRILSIKKNQFHNITIDEDDIVTEMF